MASSSNRAGTIEWCPSPKFHPVMFKNAIMDGLRDFGKCVSVHQINQDTEFLQITSAREETLLQMRTRFGKSRRRFSSDE
jgi:hypothetical protein